MSDIEDRLRDAYRTATATVSPDDIRRLGEQSVTIRLAGRASTRRIVTPLAAGAAMALIGILTAVIVPGVLASPPQHGRAPAVTPSVSPSRSPRPSPSPSGQSPSPSPAPSRSPGQSPSPSPAPSRSPRPSPSPSLPAPTPSPAIWNAPNEVFTW